MQKISKPISLTCSWCKVFEWIINVCINQYFSKNGFFQAPLWFQTWAFRYRINQWINGCTPPMDTNLLTVLTLTLKSLWIVPILSLLRKISPREIVDFLRLYLGSFLPCKMSLFKIRSRNQRYSLRICTWASFISNLHQQPLLSSHSCFTSVRVPLASFLSLSSNCLLQVILTYPTKENKSVQIKNYPFTQTKLNSFRSDQEIQNGTAYFSFFSHSQLRST